MAVASAAEAVRALCANFPRFEGELVASGERGVGYRVLAGRDALSLDQLHEPSGQQRITIAPVVSGAGGNGLGQILLGAALIAVSWWNPMGWAAAGSSSGISGKFLCEEWSRSIEEPNLENIHATFRQVFDLS